MKGSIAATRLLILLGEEMPFTPVLFRGEALTVISEKNLNVQIVPASTKTK